MRNNLFGNTIPRTSFLAIYQTLDDAYLWTLPKIKAKCRQHRDEVLHEWAIWFDRWVAKFRPKQVRREVLDAVRCQRLIGCIGAVLGLLCCSGRRLQALSGLEEVFATREPKICPAESSKNFTYYLPSFFALDNRSKPIA